MIVLSLAVPVTVAVRLELVPLVVHLVVSLVAEALTLTVGRAKVGSQSACPA